MSGKQTAKTKRNAYLSDHQKAKIGRFLKASFRRKTDEYFRQNPDALKDMLSVLGQAVEDNKNKNFNLEEGMQNVFSFAVDHFKENLAEPLHIVSPAMYMTHYSSFPGYTNMVEDFSQAAKMFRLNKAGQKNLERMINSEKLTGHNSTFYRQVFIKKIDDNEELKAVFDNFFSIYLRHAVYYVVRLALALNNTLEPRLSEELYKVPLYFDQFFKKEETTEMNISIPLHGIDNGMAIILKKPKGAPPSTPARKLIATDLFTAQRIKGGLSERHVSIIEAAYGLYESKAQSGRKAGFTIQELSEFLGKDKHAGGGMYQKMILDFTDIYNIRFHDGEGFIRLFVETKILGKANHVLFFDGTEQNDLLERCVFHITPEALDVISENKLFFFASHSYFKLEPFLKFIARKVSSTVTRNRDFSKGGEIKDGLKLSLDVLTDEAGIGFDYSQPKRELQKLIKLFKRAEQEGIVKDFFLTVKENGRHVKQDADKKDAEIFKQISKNRGNIFFNFSASDELRWTLQGGAASQLAGNRPILH